MKEVYKEEIENKVCEGKKRREKIKFVKEVYKEKTENKVCEGSL